MDSAKVWGSAVAGAGDEDEDEDEDDEDEDEDEDRVPSKCASAWPSMKRPQPVFPHVMQTQTSAFVPQPAQGLPKALRTRANCGDDDSTPLGAPAPATSPPLDARRASSDATDDTKSGTCGHVSRGLMR